MTTSYSAINTIDEFSIIGGNDINLKFTVTDKDGAAVDLTNATCTLKISPYAKPNSVITTLIGNVTTPTNVVVYTLPGSTTELMVGGKYMYQPIIVDVNDKVFRPKQGTFVLVQAIGLLSDVVDVPASAFYISATGTNNYSSTNTSITGYFEGLSIILGVANANTTASDLTLTGVVGTKALKKVDYTGTIVNLVQNDLLPNKKYLFTYNGTCWIYTGTTLSSDVAASIHLATNKTTPIDADEFGIWDNVSGLFNKVTLANLKAIWKDISGGFVGLTLLKINFKNVANTFTSFLTNSNTAARTYTFPDKDLTVAGIVDIPVKATGAELDTGTDDAKFSTAKALKDSHNVPSVVPSTSGKVMMSNGTDWISQFPITTRIDGLKMTWISATALDIGTGECYAENGDNIVIASIIHKTSVTMTASTMYHVYVYLNSGTPSAEIVTTAPVLWKGIARSSSVGVCNPQNDR